ncbi:MAG: nuclear transport factor 2 family protein [Bacteroidota bacterium]
MLLLVLGGYLSFMAKAQQGTTAGAEQMEIMMKIAGLKNALISKDSVVLSTLLSDEVSYGHTNGLVQTKSQLIRSVVSGEQDYKKMDPADMVIKIYNGTAIVTMESKVALFFNGKPLDLDMKILLVWIKQADGWKLAARQSVNKTN